MGTNQQAPRRWTEDERQRLRRMREAGDEAEAIASQLGRSVSSVRAEIYQAEHYRPAAQAPDLDLTPDELLREHGVAGSQAVVPRDRIGPAVGLLGQVRRTLYGERPHEAQPISLEEARRRLEAARPILTRLWTELAAIEAVLVPPTPADQR